MTTIEELKSRIYVDEPDAIGNPAYAHGLLMGYTDVQHAPHKLDNLIRWGRRRVNDTIDSKDYSDIDYYLAAGKLSAYERCLRLQEEDKNVY